MGVKNPFSLTFKHNHHQCRVWFLSHVRTSIFFLEGFRHGIEKKCLDLHYCNHLSPFLKLASGLTANKMSRLNSLRLLYMCGFFWGENDV